MSSGSTWQDVMSILCCDKRAQKVQEDDLERSQKNQHNVKNQISCFAAGNLPASLASAPTLSLAPPGTCQFTTEFQTVQLLERHRVSETSAVLKFGLPDDSKPLNLSTCACILAKAELPKIDGDGKEDVTRPYTPITTNNLVGSFDLLVKNYGAKGRMSRHLHEMPVGSDLSFKHIDSNVKIQAPFPQKRIGMIVGGTGITPMIQVLHAILGDEAGTTKVSMLYGSRVSTDILGMEMLDHWEKKHSGRFDVTHVLSHEAEDSDWSGERGFIGKALIEMKFPEPNVGDDAMIFVCGPPPMYNVFCGPRNEKELTGYLAEMGYQASQVYKF